MNTEKQDNIPVCPHCGAENAQVTEIWLNSVNDRDKSLCSNCNNPLNANPENNNSDIQKTTKQNFPVKFLIIFAVLSGLMIFLNKTFDVINFKEDFGQIIYYVLFIVIASSTLASGKIWRNIKHLALWFAIISILLVGYSYRHELYSVKQKVMGELIPVKGFQKNPDSISFPLSSDGHFYIRAEVNGVPITFLADTGASDIVLSPHDAKRIGIEIDKLSFNKYYETANGTVRGSSIRISDLTISEINLKKIGASVNEAAMRNSLLGMTFFKRLKSYEVKNDVLTLYWTQ